MITEEEMSKELMEKRAETHVCGECGGGLNLCWGGYYGINSYILRCSNDINHKTLADFVPNTEWEKTKEEIRRVRGMDTTALMKMSEEQMLARVGQAKFPKDLTRADAALIARVSVSYGLDPLMNELMVYQGNPYVTINARYRKAQESGKFDGIKTEPATPEERKARNAQEGDFLYKCEVRVKGANHPFVGWGRVRAAETKGNQNLPVVKDPDRQAEKRAEAQALRKAFSMPVPFQSWEEIGGGNGDNIIEGEATVIEDEAELKDQPEAEVAEKPKPPKSKGPKPKPEETEAKQPEPEAKEPEKEDTVKVTTPDQLFDAITVAKGWKTSQHARTYILTEKQFKPLNITQEMIDNEPGRVWEMIAPIISEQSRLPM